jgi:hypothetical protein
MRTLIIFVTIFIAAILNFGAGFWVAKTYYSPVVVTCVGYYKPSALTPEIIKELAEHPHVIIPAAPAGFYWQEIGDHFELTALKGAS